MSRPLAAGLLLIAATTPVAATLTGWWTWAPDGVTPHFAYQDAGSGKLVHSACNSNGSAVFPTDKMFSFPVDVPAKPATALAVSGWWDDDLGTAIASIFYQATDDSLMNAYFECDVKTGEYKLNPDGEYMLSDAVDLPSVHEKTSLSVVELGDAGGYRLFYHDEDELVNLVGYNDDTDWVYYGPVSQKAAGGMGLGSIQPVEGLNFSVVYPYDDDNFVVGEYIDANKSKWQLSSLPTDFKGTAPTNTTASDDFALASTKDAPFSLPSFDAATSRLTLATSIKTDLSIFYIGTDRKLHQITQKRDGWEVAEAQSKDKWPVADEDSAPLALISAFDSGHIWVYYRSGGEVMELHLEDGLWDDAKQPATSNGSTSADDEDDENSSGDETTTAEGDKSTPTDSADSADNTKTAAEDSGLTAGAKAGIAIGVIGGVAVIGLVAFFILRNRKKAAAGPEDGTTTDDKPPSGVPADVYYNDIHRRQGGFAPAELGSVNHSKDVDHDDDHDDHNNDYYGSRGDSKLIGSPTSHELQELPPNERFELAGDMDHQPHQEQKPITRTSTSIVSPASTTTMARPESGVTGGVPWAK